VVLPDGSRTLLPAAWTDRNGRQDDALMSSVGAETLCTISDLLKARAVMDALLSRLVESASEEEGGDAIGVGEANERSKGPWALAASASLRQTM
jgi:hypothetical protein